MYRATFVRFAFAYGILANVLCAKTVVVQDLVLEVPSGWNQIQDAFSDNTILMGFTNQQEQLNLYVKWVNNFDSKAMFVNGSQVLQEANYNDGPIKWQLIHTSKQSAMDRAPVYVTGFKAKFAGYTYYGYSKSTTKEKSEANVKQFLTAIKMPGQKGRSLSGMSFSGKKYYFGMSGLSDQDYEFMKQEVKFDVAHTSNVFTKDVGGGYIGTILNTGANHNSVTQQWRAIGQKLTSQDMYVQYSSSHGIPSGLGLGVSYDEIRDNALSYPAQEIIIFTMACYSGNLIDSFNRKKSEWQNWGAQGRTLFVMSSSASNELSSTGPHTDPEEPGGVDGSAGSAFGYSLWKALLGYADGYTDGVKDGYLSLDEIIQYVTAKSKALGQQNPRVTGVYAKNLIMNRVPPKAVREALEAEVRATTFKGYIDERDFFRF